MDRAPDSIGPTVDVALLADAVQAVRGKLFVLGGGRSNVTAAALGGNGDVLSKLDGALRRWRDGPGSSPAA